MKSKPYVKVQPQFRKSKKKKTKKAKDEIYTPEIVDLLNCFNPQILNSKELKCFTELDARKIVKRMLNSMLEGSPEIHKLKTWYYYYVP